MAHASQTVCDTTNVSLGRSKTARSHPDAPVGLAPVRSQAPLGFFGAAAKCYASDVAMEIITDAVQLLGGYDYIQDFPVERRRADAKITRICEGANQIQCIVMARSLLNRCALDRPPS